jgi:hypothetical protein
MMYPFFVKWERGGENRCRDVREWKKWHSPLLRISSWFCCRVVVPEKRFLMMYPSCVVMKFRPILWSWGKIHTLEWIRACLSRIYFSRKLKREHCFCTAILSQIVTWYKKDDVTKKNRLSHVTSCLEFVTKKACLFAIQILDAKHAC